MNLRVGAHVLGRGGAREAALNLAARSENVQIVRQRCPETSDAAAAKKLFSSRRLDRPPTKRVWPVQGCEFDYARSDERADRRFSAWGFRNTTDPNEEAS